MTKIAIFILFAIIAIVVARLLYPAPKMGQRTETTALPPPEGTKLADALVDVASEHPEESGFEPLVDGEDAFAARIAMARSATSSIDTQYYIWHKDLTGLLLLDELKKAAERGVRVRMLVDDNGTTQLDDELAALNRMPNFEVRIFNPFMLRSPRFLNYAFDFFRLNYRMHNKSFTVDNLTTIVGGRNVGDEYFGTGEQPLFVDLDVLAVGKVVQEVSDSFDAYWSCQSAFPLEQIFQSNAELSIIDEEVKKVSSGKHFQDYQEAIEESKLIQQLNRKKLSLGWSKSTLFVDNPVKTLGKASGHELLINQMLKYLGEPKKSVDLVTPYFVPGKRGLDAFSSLTKNNIDVRVLTNSMSATDVAAVHAGYAKYRRKMLKADIHLYELKSQFLPKDSHGLRLPIGSSGSSLHAKTFSIDRKKAFVGSFNFDARSANLNTELGVLIENPKLATQISELFDTKLMEVAYRPLLEDNGKMVWLEENEQGQELVLHAEPKTNLLERIIIKVLGWLPIEWLL